MTFLRRLVRVTRDDHRVTQFELFFDLVFVFAFTQVTALMAHAHSARGVAEGLAVLGILWWAWSPYTWLANQAQADRGILRAGIGIATGAAFVVALAIPDAFADEPGARLAPIVLVSGYLIVRVVHAVLYLFAAGDDRALRRQVIVTNAMSLTPTFVLLFTGAVIGGEAQLWFWAAAWICDLVLVITSSFGGGAWRLRSPSHWAERYALVVILAIGESVVSIGGGLREIGFGPEAVLGGILAIAGAFMLWWLYFDRLAEAAEQRLAVLTGARRVRVANLAYTDLHYGLVAGIVLTALGIETVMAHVSATAPLGLFGATAMAGGVSLYLGSSALIWFVAARRVLVARAVMAGLLLPAVIPTASLPPIGALLVALALGVVLILIESMTSPFRVADS